MSKYSGQCDFRDSLEIFYKDDFDKFMEGTGGDIRMYKEGKPSEIEHIIITCPADLIPLYPYLTACAAGHRREDGVYEYTPILSPKLNSWGQKYADGELKELYAQEKVKPIEEQSII